MISDVDMIFIGQKDNMTIFTKNIIEYLRKKYENDS